MFLLRLFQFFVCLSFAALWSCSNAQCVKLLTSASWTNQSYTKTTQGNTMVREREVVLLDQKLTILSLLKKQNKKTAPLLEDVVTLQPVYGFLTTF